MSGDKHKLIGKTIGGYEIISELAAGGMGAVYRGRHTRLDKLVAVKVLLPNMQQVDEYVERFHREALLAAKLEHPNIVRIYDYGQHESVFYFVMQFVEGESLSDRIKRLGRLTIRESLRITREIARGLERAHDSGLVHRDIKPDNILISNRNEVLITDFGLVKQTTSGVDAKLTSGGAILGTPYYMAPEQCEGLPNIDHRADIYSLGLIFYEMLVGKVPAEGNTAMLIMHNRILRDPPPPQQSNPQISENLSNLVMWMLRRQPAERLDSASGLIAQLNVVEKEGIGLETLPPVPRPPSSGHFPIPNIGEEAQGMSLGQAAGSLPSSQVIAVPQNINPPSSRMVSVPTNLEPPSSQNIRVPQNIEPASSQDMPAANFPKPTVSASGIINVTPTITPQSPPPYQVPAVPEVQYLPPPRAIPQDDEDEYEDEEPLPIVAILVGFVLFLGLIIGGIIFFMSDGTPNEVVLEQFTGAKTWTNQPTLELTGKTNYGPVTVMIGSESATTDESGTFKRWVKLQEGLNSIQVTVRGKKGKPVEQLLEVNLDTIPPRVTVDKEVNGRVVLQGQSRLLQGRFKDKNPLTLTLQKIGVDEATESTYKIGLGDKGRFEFQLPTTEKNQQFILVAEDRGGNRVRKEVAVQLLDKLSFEKSVHIAQWTNKKDLELTGKANFGPVKVEIGRANFTSNADGSFSHKVNLNEGKNSFLIKLSGQNGASVEQQVTIQCDTVSPSIVIGGEVKSGEVSVDRDLIFRGSVIERHLERLEINGEGVEINDKNQFQLKLSSADKKLTVLARDHAGNETRKAVTISVKASLSIKMAKDVPSFTNKSTLVLDGRVNLAKALSLQIGNSSLSTKSDGHFNHTVALENGLNSIEIVAKAEDGRSARHTVAVTRDSTAPTLEIAGEKSGQLFLGKDDTLQGQVGEAYLEYVSIAGEKIEVSSEGKFSKVLVLSKLTPTLIVARDRAGNVTKRWLKIHPGGSFAIKMVNEIKPWTNNRRLVVLGRTTQTPAIVQAGSQKRAVGKDGRFRFVYSLRREGQSRFRFKATNSYKVVAEFELVINLDTIKPSLSFEGEEIEGHVPIQEGSIIKGRIKEAHLSSATLDKEDLVVNEDGSFEAFVAEEKYSKLLTVLVKDKAGNEARRTIIVGTAKELREQAVIDALYDVRHWRKAPKSIQDQAIDKVGAILGDRYRFKEVQEYSCGGEKFRIATFVHIRSGTELQLIPGGQYQMGSGDSDKSEQPVHQVDIEPFLMGRYELKQREWTSVEGAPNGSKHKGAALPLERVSWQEAVGWLKNIGDGLRLPSESEWEYACRANTSTRYFWGDRWDEKYCWYLKNSHKNYSKKRRTHPNSEHEKFANAFGLIDMLGNVMELCQDDYLGDYKSGPSTNKARGDGLGTHRVVRGGSWRTEISYCRTYARFKHTTDHSSSDMGVRIARGLKWPRGHRPSVDVAGPSIGPKRAPLESRKLWQKTSPNEQDKAILVMTKRLAGAFQYRGTKVYQRGDVRHRIASYVHKKTGMEFQLIPGGVFTMGSKAGKTIEKPSHEVTIKKAFLIGRYEVMQREWDKIGVRGRDKRQWRGGAMPIETVSWKDIQYWLKKAGDGFRLPSESEWEYACRAGTSSKHFWGDSWDGRYCWYRDNSDQNYSKKRRTHPGAEHDNRANSFGLVDMLGNVREWCQDDYVASYAKGPFDQNPMGRGRAEYRVARGGSWFTDKNECRSAARFKYNTVHTFKDLGFRVAVTIPN